VEEEGDAAMTVTLNLDPEVEKGLIARAHAQGVSVDDYLRELVAKEAGLQVAADPRPIHERFDNLSDLLLNSPFAGADLDLERSKDYPRPVDIG
jgi:plasmid stability protein